MSRLRAGKRWKYLLVLHGMWVFVMALTAIVDVAPVSAVFGWTCGLFGGLLIAANESRSAA